MANVLKNPTKPQKTVGVVQLTLGPIADKVYAIAAKGSVRVKMQRRSMWLLQWMLDLWARRVMLSVRWGLSRAREKRLAFERGRARAEPMATERTAGPTYWGCHL